MLLVRHGSLGVLEAGTNLGFALVQHVPVVEGGHEARGWDAEGLAAVGGLGRHGRRLCLGQHVRKRLGDLVGHLVGQRSAAWLGGMGGPDLRVECVGYLAGERRTGCCVRSGREGAELALERTWRATVQALAGLVQVPVARDAWWRREWLCTVNTTCLVRRVPRTFELRG